MTAMEDSKLQTELKDLEKEIAKLSLLMKEDKEVYRVIGEESAALKVGYWPLKY